MAECEDSLDHPGQSRNDLQKCFGILRPETAEDGSPASHAAIELLLVELIEPCHDRIITPVADAQARDGLSLHVICRFIQNGTALDGSIRQLYFSRYQEELVGLVECIPDCFVCYRGERNINSPPF